MSAEDKCALVRKYLEARKCNNAEACLALVDNKVEYLGGRGEVVHGKEEFEAYLKAHAAKGEWEEPLWDEALGVVRVSGSAGWKLITVSIEAKYWLSDDNLIVKICTGRKA
uniref:SnoaL-like domain-containing protein n=1 Tax=Timspurckia oligopyrenoides TaxID=708627 RepID=A0A7S0ZFN5_9RHOD|mmetsp:Transcript_3491/g.6113  ORF Transcript_3491/g.6113 Transcript_3491/m.6113 type:complete len:111 (+) Transcript_3491:180-512(+)